MRQPACPLPRLLPSDGSYPHFHPCGFLSGTATSAIPPYRTQILALPAFCSPSLQTRGAVPEIPLCRGRSPAESPVLASQRVTGQGLDVEEAVPGNTHITLEGLSLQVAVGEGGREPQGIAADISGDIRRGERQGCPRDAVQQTRHSVGSSAQGLLKETGQLGTEERPITLQAYSHLSALKPGAS